jgi:hypothetical protein
VKPRGEAAACSADPHEPHIAVVLDALQTAAAS